MATVTVPELVARAVAAADMQDNFVTEAQWLYWANVANKKLAVKVAQLGVPYNQYDEVITFDASSDYTIVEPLAIVGVYFAQQDGRLRKLKAVHPSQRINYATTNSGYPEEFQVRRVANNLRISFYPVPTTGSAIVRAINYPANLVYANPTGDDVDYVYYPLGWEDFIVLHMARNACAKEETINPLIESQLRDCENHIETSASNYLMTDLPKILDTKNNSFDTDIWYWPI
jgi:hypothetical protein